MATMVAMASTESSPLADALARVGDKWTLLIVEALLQGPRRFNELIEDLPGIAPNVLSQRLKHLEQEALLVARPYSQRPPRLDYELTGGGSGASGGPAPPGAVGGPGSRSRRAPRHAACGSVLEARWYCPTCARVVNDHDDEELRFA